MLKVRNVQINNPYGAGFECKVTMQFGIGAYDKAEIELPPADVREIIALAIAKATATIAVDDSEVKIAGEEQPDEVEEAAPVPVFHADSDLPTKAAVSDDEVMF